MSPSRPCWFTTVTTPFPPAPFLPLARVTALRFGKAGYQRGVRTCTEDGYGSRLPFKTTAKLDNLIVNRYLSAADDDFVYCVELDIRRFIERANPKAVLIFPPFSNYRRFLVHKVCASKAFSQHDVVTFSIGVGNERRTVVCFRHQLLQDIKSSSTGKSFEEPTTESAVSPNGGPQLQYASWRSSTTPPTASTNTATTVCSGTSGSSSTSSTHSSNGHLPATTTCIARKRPEKRDPSGQDNMGTETILQLAGAGGHHHHHQQQRQHNQTQPYLSDGGGAFGGDSVKASGDVATQPHLDVFANNHPHIHPPPGAGVKLPPVVGIYRPPAARRALQLAEKAFHQLAPPAACDHPSDYTHLPAAEGTTDKAVLRSPDSTESTPRSNEGKTGEKTGPTSESGASSNKWSPTQQASPPVPEGALGSDCNSVNSIVVSPTSARINRPHRERRPDRAVYIPRARRSLTTPPVTTSSLLPVSGDAASKAAAPIAGSPPKGLTRTVVASTNRTQPPDTDAAAAFGEAVASSSSCCPVVVLSPEGTGSKGKPKPHTESVAAESSSSVGYSLAGGTVQCNKSVLNCDSVIEESSKRRAAQSSHQRVPGEAFKQRSYSLEEQQDHQQTAVTRVEDSDTRGDRLQIVNEVSCDLAQQQQQQQQKKQQQSSSGQESSNAICDFQQPTNTREYPVEGGPVVLSKPTVEPNDTMHRTNNRHRNAKNVATVPANTTTTGMIINDRPTEGEKLDRDEKELRRASQEMNRSNRRIMKQTFNSDVLEIDEPAPPKPQGGGGLAKKPEKKVAVQNGDTNGVGKSSAIVAATINGGGGGGVATQNGKVSDGDGAGEEDEDEEDWESMYDDNGDCLNPKMLEELTSAVGKVSIEAPHSDYKAYQTKQAVLNEEEFPHVLEVSNFPAEFKTQDLMMLFSQYKESGFDIKWVDDTHALAVFSSSKIAAEVLATGHSFAQVKPLAEATSESRSKARKCASSLQPYRARPETCAALARRLVTTALGVRLKTAPEERENERRVLREAKERKLLAAKQRDEVWDS